MKIGHISQGEVINEAHDLYARWGKPAPEHKRHIVETITETIVIGKDDVSINLLYAPEFPQASLNARGKATRQRGRVTETVSSRSQRCAGCP